MRAVRKDYFLDHDPQLLRRSVDWERVIKPNQRNIKFPQRGRWKRSGKSSRGRAHVQKTYPKLRTRSFRTSPTNSSSFMPKTFLKCIRTSPARRAKTEISRIPVRLHHRYRVAAEGRYPHENRAADYDDLGDRDVVEGGEDAARVERRHTRRNPVTRRRHELTSMGIRVNAEP